ncbi:MAG: hypothetical protein HYT43_02175 [Candidatus Taylorbacteria bacterium]|nr:hypothetical protein [Candidatus Taylorbacteria bacterium]
MNETLTKLILKLNEQIVNPLMELLFALAVVVFVWGVYEFIRGADNEQAREKGRLHMIWGIVGIAIMVSVYGIIAVIVNTLGIPPPDIPFFLPI